MNLLELEKIVKDTIEVAKECDYDPKEITVSVQIEENHPDKEPYVVWSDKVELKFDCDGDVSGCVFFGEKEYD